MRGEEVTPELIEAIKGWITEPWPPNEALDQAIDAVANGRNRAPQGDPLLNKIATEMVAHLLPEAIQALVEGNGPPNSPLRRLRQASDLLSSVAEWANQCLKTDLSNVSSFSRAFPQLRAIFEMGDRYTDMSWAMSLYREYVSIGASSPTLERLILCAAVEQCLRQRSERMVPELSGEQGTGRDSPLSELLGLYLFVGLLSFGIARLWGWVTLPAGSYDEGYVSGWVLGRAMFLFVVFAALGTFGTLRVWAHDARRWSARKERADEFRRSALVSMYAECLGGTQARLAKLAAACLIEGVTLPDPVDAILQRANARSPDDWLAA